ncbi:glycerol kinase GlpK [Mesomycoplasma flocculare]|uniref:Glycerol kinase n=1 Tax=Mesomycoplasma flocculare ATCC 27399 TaxID=743971 RepID=A0A0A8E874_MESFC|nr:glycerol kinase GlpK [Mesomycoplasma flocculare]AJC49812.1 glycerol kinase [Mesomycoplasma flocculare ATCC 27399]MXR06108.1 glycerol kinase [Mesomycoplasma flocculare]
MGENNNKKFVIALDSGTSSCRSLIFDKKGEIIAFVQKEFSQHFPRSGWVEHDANEIWNTQIYTMQTAKAKADLKATNFVALGITNQRETVVLWDKSTGEPVYNAIVWQDRRTSEFCEQLRQKGYENYIKEITGLIINPYFSATKISWILKNVPKAKKVFAANNLLAGTIDTWLVWKLTNGKVHATDVSNASRTMLFNIQTKKWDKKILDLLEIPQEILPKVLPSAADYGIVEPNLWANNEKAKVPIFAVIGDQQAALFGQLCTEIGMVKNTYGTGCFTLLNTGEKLIYSKNNLLTTIAWQIGNNPVQYALEGSVFVAGAAIQWLRDGLGISKNLYENDFLSTKISTDNHSLIFVPSFTGLGAPYWDSYSRGAIFGLERSSKKEDIIKAALESIAFQSNDLIKAMEADLGHKISVMKVDGGVSKNDFLMQFQSSISQLEITRPKNTETTAMGAAFLAGLFAKFWKSISELEQILEIEKKFYPKFNQFVAKRLTTNWDLAVRKTLNWKKDIK